MDKGNVLLGSLALEVTVRGTAAVLEVGLVANSLFFPLLDWSGTREHRCVVMVGWRFYSGVGAIQAPRSVGDRGDV